MLSIHLHETCSPFSTVLQGNSQQVALKQEPKHVGLTSAQINFGNALQIDVEGEVSTHSKNSSIPMGPPIHTNTLTV